uniref:hypothetical protein n=1 Tax=Sandaracinus sp. TaxID=2024858 RepID=UPI0019D48386|nr:hypothetical protein [Sandaracinus sp.]
MRSKSFATCPTVLSPTAQRRTASALNSGLNFLRFLFTIEHSSRMLARSGVSTEAGEDHPVAASVESSVVEDLDVLEDRGSELATTPP